jgi:hypothetical protein
MDQVVEGPRKEPETLIFVFPPLIIYNFAELLSGNYFLWKKKTQKRNQKVAAAPVRQPKLET